MNDKIQEAMTKLGLETIEDLAFFFTSAAKAAEAGVGADTWGAARRKAHDAGMASAKRVLAATAPRPQLITRKAETIQPRGSRAQDFAMDSSKRSKAAARAWSIASRWTPHNRKDEITERLEGFEASTVDSNVRTWIRWERWCKASGLSTASATRAKVLNFLSTVPAKSKEAVWSHLNWLARELGAAIPIGEIPRPKKALADHTQPEQAALPTPEVMWAVLQRNDIDMFQAAVHMMRLGILRFKHVQRSVLIEIGKWTITGCCMRSKTKKAGKRAAFLWSAPRYDEANRDVGKYIWDNWMAESKKIGSPLPCALPVGDKPLSLESFHKGMRERFQEITEEAKDMTSYSWRRFAATLAEARQADHAARLRLGAWREALGVETSTKAPNSMPYHYAGDKSTGEKQEKLIQCIILKGLTLSSWPRLRMDVIDKKAEAARQAAEMAADDAPEFEVEQSWRPAGISNKEIKIKRSWVDNYRSKADQSRKRPRIENQKEAGTQWIATQKGKVHLAEGGKPLCNISMAASSVHRQGPDILKVIKDEADNICDRCFAKADQQLKDGITKAMAKHV